MKRIVFYIIVLLAAVLIPEQGMDVGELLPVELVSVYTEANRVTIETDTGDSGRGETIQEAFWNLEETTAGVIYLDTADYLLISDDALLWLDEMQQYLKPKVYVCSCNEEIDLEEAAAFLAIHKPDTVLKEAVQEGTIKQELCTKDGRKYLSKKDEKVLDKRESECYYMQAVCESGW